MPNQRTLRFSLNRNHGQLAVHHKIGESILNHPRNLEIPKPKKRWPKAEMLKRIARRAMADVTECPPDTIGAHVARIDDLCEIVTFELHHDLKESPEATLSAMPFRPYTLADYLHCLNFTRKQHRAPAFVNQRDEDISQIKNMVCTLAGLIAHNPEALDLFQRQFNRAQIEEAA